MIGAAISSYRMDREATARRVLLERALFLAEADKARVVGVHLTAAEQWQVVPLADAGAAFGWFGDVTHGGYHPDPGTFTVWVDKGKGDWRETAFTNALYGRGR